MSIDPGQMPLAEVRLLMGRTRVAFGSHGSAWSNAFFAPLHRPDVHLIEFNWLRGRGFFPRLVHYVTGRAHHWTLESEPYIAGPITHVPAMPTSQVTSHFSNSYNLFLVVNEDDVHTVLWHAGILGCSRWSEHLPPPPSDRPGAYLELTPAWLPYCDTLRGIDRRCPIPPGTPAVVVPMRNSSFRCRA